MVSAHDLLAVAGKYIGYCEEPAGSNRNQFAAVAGHANGQPWCATFIVATAKQAGVSGVPNTAYTPAMANGFRQAGRVVPATQARPGDVLLMNFRGGKNRIEHVEWIEDGEGGTFRTIGGNTSRRGSQSNGGMVCRQTRRVKDLVEVVVGRPVYDGISDGASKEARYGFGLGTISGDVLTWQRQLNAVTSAGLETDGEFGTATLHATRAFQAARGLATDGWVSPETVAAMEQAYAERQQPEPPQPPKLEVAVRWAVGHPVDERIGRALGALMCANASTLEDRRRIGTVHLVGEAACEGFERSLADRCVEHGRSVGREGTWASASAVCLDYLTRL